MRKFTFLALLLAMLWPPAAASGQDKHLVVGSKEFTEQIILGRMMITLLESHGFTCKDRTGLGGTMVARKALESGQIDIYMEYTGTALMAHLKHKRPITDPARCYEVVKREDAQRNSLAWLPRMRFNNSYCLMMRRTEAAAQGIRTISDLARFVRDHPGKVSFGMNAEFYARPDGYRPLQRRYGFRFPTGRIVKMDSGLLYKALKEGQVDVAMGFATDGRIMGYDFLVLEDDLRYFPVYNPAPVVRCETARKYPELERIFARLGQRLTTPEITRLNYRVDIHHENVGRVVRQWLEAQGLIR